MRRHLLCSSLASTFFCYGFLSIAVRQQTKAFLLYSTNVTRRETGDYFTNPNVHCSSDSCNEAGGYYRSKCECQCPYGKTTYLVYETKCEDDLKLPSDLPKTLPKGLAMNGSIFRLSSSRTCTQYTRKPAPVIYLAVPGQLFLCTVVNGKNKKDSTGCEVEGKKSRYRYEHDWREIWPSGRSQDVFSILKNGNTGIVFKWNSNLGQQFNGLVFALHISCNKGSRQSVLILKSAGFRNFNGIYPTLSPTPGPTVTPPVPRTTTPTNVPTKTAATTTPTVPPGDKGKSSSGDGDQGLVIALSLVAVFLVLLLIAGVIFYVRYHRRKPGGKGAANTEANPTYDRGPDSDITMNGDNNHKYDTPIVSSGYQPLVHNTRMKDAHGRIPVYHPLTSSDSQTSVSDGGKDHEYESIKHEYESVNLPMQQQPTALNPGCGGPTTLPCEYDKPEYTDPNELAIPEYTDPNEPAIPEYTDPNELAIPEYTDPNELAIPEYTDPNEPMEPEYTDPVQDGALYAVSNVPSTTPHKPVDFNNLGYCEPDKILPIA